MKVETQDLASLLKTASDSPLLYLLFRKFSVYYLHLIFNILSYHEVNKIIIQF